MRVRKQRVATRFDLGPIQSVRNPIDGEALNVARLAAYYKGNVAAGRYAVEKRLVATGGRH
jgi:hypothetical protein